MNSRYGRGLVHEFLVYEIKRLWVVSPACMSDPIISLLFWCPYRLNGDMRREWLVCTQGHCFIKAELVNRFHFSSYKCQPLWTGGFDMCWWLMWVIPLIYVLWLGQISFYKFYSKLCNSERLCHMCSSGEQGLKSRFAGIVLDVSNFSRGGVHRIGVGCRSCHLW